MKLTDNEKIIFQKKKLTYGVFIPYPKEKGVLFSWYYGGGASIQYSYGFVNIFLTNRRIYAELMLFHKPIFDIPFTKIKDFRKERKGLSNVIVINYLKDNEKRCVILNLGKDIDIWLKEMSKFGNK